MNTNTHQTAHSSRQPTWLTAPLLNVRSNAAFCKLSNVVKDAARKLFLITNSHLSEATSVTAGPLQDTIESCLLLYDTPNRTFACDKDLFKKWNETILSSLPLQGPSEGNSKPETAYEKARRVYVDMVTQAGSARRMYVDMITQAGSLLFPTARSYNFAAQDEMLSRVKAFCEGEPNWHLASQPTPAPSPKRPWDRISQINEAAAKFEALPTATQTGLGGTLASILLEELTRRTPMSPYEDAKALLLSTLSDANPRSPDKVTNADSDGRSPRKCRHNHDYEALSRTYNNLRNSINKSRDRVKNDDYSTSPPSLRSIGVSGQLAWPLKQTVASTDPRIIELHEANSQHYQQWLKRTSEVLPAVDTIYRTAAALQDAKEGDLEAITLLLRESVWHLDETRFGKGQGSRDSSDLPVGSLESLCQQAEDALTRIENTRRQDGGVHTEIWDRREYQETPGKVNMPGGDWKFSCSALLEGALGHLEGSWETSSDESEPVRRLGIVQ